MPNRGNGITLLQNSRGSITDNLLNTAVINVPITAETTLVAGLIPSFGGYEVQQSNQMLTLTHNLLYDFSDPGSYVGIGANYGGNWAWKFFLGNEQYRTYGSVTQKGVNALGDPITTSNKVPTFTARADYTWSSALDIGGSFNIGRQTLASAIDPTTGAVNYGPGGAAPSAYGSFFFGELGDLRSPTFSTTRKSTTAVSSMRHSTASRAWYGLSLLAHRKFNAPVVGRMGVTLRYDLLANSKNGGGGGIALNATDGPEQRFRRRRGLPRAVEGRRRPGLRVQGPCAGMSRSTCCSIRPSRSP